MTDRSKSPRKRRLQLNAEEFAPPSDMYEASQEPRLDETWVQFYGGERQGIKRLSSLEDETSSENIKDGAAALKPNYPAEISSAPLTGPQSIIKPSTEPYALIRTDDEPPVERRSRPLLSRTGKLRRQEKSDADDEHGVRVSHEAIAPDTSQATESKAANISEPHSVGVPFPGESEAGSPYFAEWSQRWSPWLKRGGSIKVCEAFFLLTHARGSAECFTTNAEIMKLTELSRAQCIRNIHYLIEAGFLDELNEVNNKEAKGTYYRFNLVPKSFTTS